MTVTTRHRPAEPTPHDAIGWRRGRRSGRRSLREWLVTNGLGGYASGTVAASPRAATTAC